MKMDFIETVKLNLSDSFYSVFPVPKDNSHEVNLDVSHLEKLDFKSVCDGIDTVPDVLILPSMLKQFNKVSRQ